MTPPPLPMAPFNTSAPFGGGGGGASPPPPLKDWAKFSSWPSADPKFSLVPLAALTLDQNVSSAPLAPLKPQTTGGGGGGWTHPPGKRSPAPPPPQNMREDPDRTFPLQLRCNRREIVFGAVDYWRKRRWEPFCQQRSGGWVPVGTPPTRARSWAPIGTAVGAMLNLVPPV